MDGKYILPGWLGHHLVVKIERFIEKDSALKNIIGTINFIDNIVVWWEIKTTVPPHHCKLIQTINIGKYDTDLNYGNEIIPILEFKPNYQHTFDIINYFGEDMVSSVVGKDYIDKHVYEFLFANIQHMKKI